MLRLEHVSKSFGGIQAVQDCSFTISPGKITALIGPNGSGKTTVFQLISGLLRPASGRIFLRDRDITHLAPDVISNLGISRVFQQARLFGNLTAEENVLLALDQRDTGMWRHLWLGSRDDMDRRVPAAEALKRVGMVEQRHRLARDLSYGQKRLVELARALANPHHLLMLDEPLAGVNPQLRGEIQKLLEGLQKEGETIFLIEHDMNFTLSIADEVVVMDAGKVIAQGSPKVIRKMPAVLEAYLG